MKNVVKYDSVVYKVFRKPEEKKHSVVLEINDFNIEGYEFRLSVAAARKLGQKLIDAANEVVVSRVMET
jgi:hypothetical protein